MTLQVETAEALCSALYQLPYSEFLGEKDLPEGRCAWFHIGEKPKDMRVTVVRPQRPAEEVVMRLEWRNYHTDPRNPLRGTQNLRITTRDATKAELEQATTDAIVRVLEVYRDVLAEEGVAGKIADLVAIDEKYEATDE